MKFLFICFLIIFYICLLNAQNLFASTKFELNSDLPIEDFVIAGLSKDEKPIIIEAETKKNLIEEVIPKTPLILSTTIEQSTIATTTEAHSTVVESITLQTIKNVNQPFIPNNLPAQKIQPLQPLFKLPTLRVPLKNNKQFKNFNNNNKNVIKNSEKWFIENFNLKDCSNNGDFVSQAFRRKFPSNLLKNDKKAILADLLSTRIKECHQKNNINHWTRVESLLSTLNASIIEQEECRNGLIEEQIACLNVVSYSCQIIQPSYAFKLIPTRIVVQEARLAEDGADKCRKFVRKLKHALNEKSANL